MTGKQKFKMKPSGRCGDIIYRDGEHEKTIDWEMSGVRKYHILIAPLDFRFWDKPEGEPIPVEDQYRLLNELRDWLKKKRIKSDIAQPKVDNRSNDSCSWSGCSNPILKGMKVCAEHFDKSLLNK